MTPAEIQRTEDLMATKAAHPASLEHRMFLLVMQLERERDQALAVVAHDQRVLGTIENLFQLEGDGLLAEIQRLKETT